MHLDTYASPLNLDYELRTVAVGRPESPYGRRNAVLVVLPPNIHVDQYIAYDSHSEVVGDMLWDLRRLSASVSRRPVDVSAITRQPVYWRIAEQLTDFARTLPMSDRDIEAMYQLAEVQVEPDHHRRVWWVQLRFDLRPGVDNRRYVLVEAPTYPPPAPYTPAEKAPSTLPPIHLSGEPLPKGRRVKLGRR